MDSAPIFFSHDCPKEKVIVIMEDTGAGKSSLSIDLATCLPSLKSSIPIKCKSTKASISPPTRSPFTSAMSSLIDPAMTPSNSVDRIVWTFARRLQ
ncbi:hypothetical protein K1719_030356 [Acacia pycnantha]|nr:hypothetical protein K1719_030356 [Acacia pycnantha]